MYYVFQHTDELNALARQHGLGSGLEIYSHEKNAALRQKRPDPKAIYPGDLLFIPANSSQPPEQPPAGVSRIDPALKTRRFAEVRFFDIWGNRADETTARLLYYSMDIGGVSKPQAMRFPIEETGRYQLIVDSENLFAMVLDFDVEEAHEPLGALHFSGLLGEASDPKTGVVRMARSLAIERRGKKSRIKRAVYYIDLYLSDPWFVTTSTPPRDGCKVEVLVDGEEAWKSVVAELRKAQDTIHITTWMYQSTTELLRPRELEWAPYEEREKYTIHEYLLRSPARKRLLLFDWPVMGPEDKVKKLAKEAGDNFEVMEQKNPTKGSIFWGSKPEYVVAAHPAMKKHSLFNWGWLPVGSYHQKTMTIDSRVGFCGGMNLKENDWDTSDHDIYDPRRCASDRSPEHRKKVSLGQKRTDNAPRHDFIARVEGPAVRDLEYNFNQRWNYTLDQKAKNWQSASKVAEGPLPPKAGSMRAQIVRTMPPPFHDTGILQAHKRAIAMARRMIYVEDQYFRSRELSDAMREAKRRSPDLHIIVVTPDPGFASRSWTRTCVETIQETAKEFHPVRLQMWDGGEEEFVPIDTHAKIMIVDDVWCTVGSANLNDRGMDYEGEINVAYLEPANVKALRLKLFREHLEGDPRLTGDIDNDVAVWKAHVSTNASAEEREVKPKSRIFPLDLGKGIFPKWMYPSPELM